MTQPIQKRLEPTSELVSPIRRPANHGRPLQKADHPSFGHIARGRAGAQYPKNAVDRSPLVGNGRTAFATIGKQGVENAPFRVRQIAATQCCLPSERQP